VELFVSFVVKLMPVYALIAAGFLVGKKLRIKKEDISNLLIYLLTPVVIFNAVYRTELTKETLLLPVVFFVLCSVIAIGAYLTSINVKPKAMRGMLAFAAGSGNTGYFGLPVALVLFGDEVLGLVVLCVLGYTIYETLIGFILIANGKYGPKESLHKLLHLPILYAFLIGAAFQTLGLELGSIYNDFVPNFIGAYVLLGSLLVGLALSELTKTSFDLNAITRSFVAKFVLWPVVVTALILIDISYLEVFVGTENVYEVAFLMSIVPIAANTVAYASFLRAEPQKAALIVFTSTIFAIVYIPIMVSIVLPRII